MTTQTEANEIVTKILTDVPFDARVIDVLPMRKPVREMVRSIVSMRAIPLECGKLIIPA